MAFLLFKFTFMILKWGLQRLANAYYLVRGQNLEYLVISYNFFNCFNS